MFSVWDENLFKDIRKCMEKNKVYSLCFIDIEKNSYK